MSKFIINSVCPDIESLEKLAQGKLPDDQAVEIRQHLSECSNCRDLYEALQDVDNDFVNSALPEINSRISSRAEQIKSNKGKVVKMIAKYVAAASIAGVCAWGISNIDDKGNSNNDFSLVQEEEVKTPQKNDEASSPNQPIIESSEKKEEASQPTTSNDTKESTSVSQKKNQVPVENVPSKRSEPSKDSETEIVVRGGESVKGVNTGRSRSTISVDSIKVNKLMDAAMILFEAGEYYEAKEAFEDILNEDPNNNKAIKRLAICDFNLKYYSQALQNFRRVKPSSTKECREIDDYIEECNKNIKK